MILALDQGTTSSRAILFDHSGNSAPIVASREFPQHFPQPGWVEHDPHEIWDSQIAVAREVLRENKVSSADLSAIGITNQRETVVLWDRQTGQPIHHAIVWQDRRTAGACDQLVSDGLEALFTEKTGLLIDPYFSGTKISWLLDQVPGARRRAEHGEIAFGTIDSWLVWNLTGGQLHLTDVSNASRTLLFNIHDLEWDEELLDILKIPREILPEVRSSSEVYGTTREELLGSEVSIAGIAGDQQAALFGQACHEPGQAKNTYGTGCFLLMNTGETPVRSENRLLTTVAWKIGDRVDYALEGSVFIAGAAVQWLRDQLGIIRDATEVEELARTVPDSGGVYFVPAFAGLGSPHWDPYARGAIVGLSRGSSKAHLARATLEAIAFQSLELLQAMERDSGIQLSELRVDGGASLNSLLLQIQADLLQVPVIRPQVSETTALGAAYLAGLAVGFWASSTEIGTNWKEATRCEPQVSPESIQPRIAGWNRAVDSSRDWASPR